MPTLSQLALASLGRLISTALFALLLAASVSRAQIGGIESDPGEFGAGSGNNRIEGRIYMPSNDMPNQRFRVRVTSVRAGDQFTMADSNGSFAIRRLAAGTYTITVEAGSAFATATETVDIRGGNSRTGSGQTVYVEIRLRPRTNTNAPTTTGTVNASLANLPPDARRLYDEALASARAGDHQAAVTKLRSAIDTYPNFALAHNELGVQYLRLSQLDNALNSFRAAVRLAPESFTARLNLGIALMLKREYREAEEALRAALQRNETSALAHFHHGHALIRLQRLDEAETSLRRALTLGGDEMKRAHRFLAHIYVERRDNARAIAELETYLRLDPQVSDAAQIREMIGGLRRGQTGGR
jgi:Flp pilus assembly protein TadD